MKCDSQDSGGRCLSSRGRATPQRPRPASVGVLTDVQSKVHVWMVMVESHYAWKPFQGCVRGGGAGCKGEVDG